MNQSRATVEGAVTVAIYAVILLMTLYIIPLSVITMWFLPLPIFYFVGRRGLRTGWLAFIVALVISLLLGGPYTLVFSAYFLITGMVMGALLFRKRSAFAILLGGSLSNIVILLIAYGVTLSFFHVDPVVSFQSAVRESIQSSAGISGLFGANSKQGMAIIQQQINAFQYYIPYIIVITGVVMAFVMELLATPILRRLKVGFPKWPPLHQWNFPKSMIWYYLLVLLIILLVPLSPKDSLYIVVENCYRLLETVMAIQGITFLFYFAYAKRIRKVFPIIVAILVLLLPLLYLIEILGIIDLGFNLRERMKRK